MRDLQAAITRNSRGLSPVIDRDGVSVWQAADCWKLFNLSLLPENGLELEYLGWDARGVLDGIFYNPCYFAAIVYSDGLSVCATKCGEGRHDAGTPNKGEAHERIAAEVFSKRICH